MLRGIKTDVIHTTLEFRPVEYPGTYPLPDSLAYNLIETGDYDLLIKISDDEFVKSWTQYKRFTEKYFNTYKKA